MSQALNVLSVLLHLIYEFLQLTPLARHLPGLPVFGVGPVCVAVHGFTKVLAALHFRS